MSHVEAFGAALLSQHPKMLFSEFASGPIFNDKKVDEIECDFDKLSNKDVSLETLLSTCKKKIAFRWGDFTEGKNLTYDPDGIIKFSLRPYQLNPIDALLEIKSLNWQVINFSSAFYAWEDLDFPTVGFGGGMGLLGWGCAFKGEGHNRVVSRRFLEHGPWRVIRDNEHDITLIQFHDLEADAQTAMEQAKPGHDRMAKPMEGGFIQKNVRLANPDFSSLYSAEEKMLSIVVPVDEGVSHAAMLDMCKVRHYQLLENQPVERIAFVFLQESDARVHLHELWLRELECWTIIKGERVRLDLDYAPLPYEKPDWVNSLEQP
jgi:hypothetical protein